MFLQIVHDSFQIPDDVNLAGPPAAAMLAPTILQNQINLRFNIQQVFFHSFFLDKAV
jgi:hypothetical protein